MSEISSFLVDIVNSSKAIERKSLLIYSIVTVIEAVPCSGPESNADAVIT